MDKNVLVLNASYEAINVCNLRRAIKMIVKGVAHPEELSDRKIHSTSVVMRIPLVVRLVRYVHVPRSIVKFSRKNVLMRDRFTCQYCGKMLAKIALTLDHVFPRSRGGKTSWDNVVTACKKCNSQKGDRTPIETQMFPKRKPKAPHIIAHLNATYRANRDVSWDKYLYM